MLEFRHWTVISLINTSIWKQCLPRGRIFAGPLKTSIEFLQSLVVRLWIYRSCQLIWCIFVLDRLRKLRFYFIIFFHLEFTPSICGLWPQSGGSVTSIFHCLQSLLGYLERALRLFLASGVAITLSSIKNRAFMLIIPIIKTCEEIHLTCSIESWWKTSRLA